MKINVRTGKKVRIEMLPLIDIVFLLLVFFIFTMLSMAVHRSLPIMLPTSSSAKIDKELVLSVTIKSDRTIYVDKERIAFDDLASVLRTKTASARKLNKQSEKNTGSYDTGSGHTRDSPGIDVQPPQGNNVSPSEAPGHDHDIGHGATSNAHIRTCGETPAPPRPKTCAC